MGGRRSIAQWVDLMTKVDLPVLARSVMELDRMRADGEKTSPQSVADTVLHDPFMTAKVLRYLQQHRGRRRTVDITTIAHALMMLGLSPFYEHFGVQSVIEEQLAGDDAALEGMLTVMYRARHAALYARDWARWRKDIDPEEVMVAALLHDLAEMLLWGFAPSLAGEIAAMQKHDRTLRSDAAQQVVLGFHLIDLQLAMVKAWQLPDLLHVLMDVQHGRNPRVLNVEYAVAVARHSAQGWDDTALPHDYALIGEWIGVTPEEVAQRVSDVATKASSEGSWYGIAPAESSEEMPPP
ncbi:MAG: HDOD domain-containing protein [Burkholderiales bacterium]